VLIRKQIVKSLQLQNVLLRLVQLLKVLANVLANANFMFSEEPNILLHFPIFLSI
jgi:hypothetical protein